MGVGRGRDEHSRLSHQSYSFCSAVFFIRSVEIGRDWRIGRKVGFGISRIWDEVMSALLYRKDLLVLYRDTLHS